MAKNDLRRENNNRNEKVLNGENLNTEFAAAEYDFEAELLKSDNKRSPRNCHNNC
ncbi:hypothetical protein [Evansella tamaricis]|uniref:YfhD family protein n=1 Tax=Evansella tamaricis TaxID=2069301 RepID=A0ABS6JL14_9BACI|nr:hypothetical protein [Evansella tamaricis]MBU9714075.1 hypothetical protein [Evansella tamaricis]